MRYACCLFSFAFLGVLPAWADENVPENAPQSKPETVPKDIPESPPDFRYVLGVRVHREPEAAGARGYDTSLTPIWAVRWGRWHISTSGGTNLLGFGSEVRGDGASTDLVKSDKLRLGVSLRIDSGRTSSDASTTMGLDDVKRTLRGRFYAGYTITPDWQISGSLSQDLLGNKGGMVGVVDLGWRLRQSARSEWTAGVGLSFADATNMHSYFGISPQGSANTGLPVYQPAGGLRDVHAGMGWTFGITQRWIVFGALGSSYLLGPAADSPLTQQRLGYHVATGLAYRN